MATLVHFLALQSVESGNSLTSVERIMEYGQLEPEAPLESIEGKLARTPFILDALFTPIIHS